MHSFVKLDLYRIWQHFKLLKLSHKKIWHLTSSFFPLWSRFYVFPLVGKERPKRGWMLNSDRDTYINKFNNLLAPEGEAIFFNNWALCYNFGLLDCTTQVLLRFSAYCEKISVQHLDSIIHFPNGLWPPKRLRWNVKHIWTASRDTFEQSATLFRKPLLKP